MGQIRRWAGVAIGGIVAWAFAADAAEPRAPTPPCVPQSATTPRFAFCVVVASHEADQPGEVLQIRVVERATARVHQVIDVADALPVGVPDDAKLSVVDADFDGMPDFSIPFADGGAGPNSTYGFYRFDRATDHFRLDEALSDMTQVVFDPGRRTVTSSERNGCCQHSSATYRWVGGKLLLVGTWDETFRADTGRVETRVGILRDGRMRYRTTARRAPSGN